MGKLYTGLTTCLVLIVVGLTDAFIFSRPKIGAQTTSFTLSVIHTNDVHSRFEETDKYGGRCSDEDKAADKCYDGAARRFTKVQELRSQNPNSIFLDAGDQFQGTLWFYHYKGEATVHFMKMLGYDVMALGNHEFDNGVEGLVPFLRNATTSFQVLSTNIEAASEPSIQGLFNKSTILDVQGNKIGIIGYTTKETPQLATTGSLEFRDEIVAITEEVKKLEAQGINKIIAVGHAGYEVDKEIARKVKGVDLVVGGHSHSFLYTGTPPSNEKPVGPYPTIIEQADGHKVYVVQAYAWGKYMGYINLTFDGDGKVTEVSGKPQLLDSSVKPDNGTLNEIQTWREPLTAILGESVGTSAVLLDGSVETCRFRECNMGDFLTDGIVYELRRESSQSWANTSIAVYNSGGIRASIGTGNVTYGDVLTVLPFRNTIGMVEMLGSDVWKMLEFSVSRYKPDGAGIGGFLQMSGIMVTYEYTRPVNQRVKSVYIKCVGCKVPQYLPLEMDKYYNIFTNDFVINGGDGYSIFKKARRRHNLGTLSSTILKRYVTRRSPVVQGTERRIVLQRHVSSAPSVTTSGILLTCLCIISSVLNIGSPKQLML